MRHVKSKNMKYANIARRFDERRARKAFFGLDIVASHRRAARETAAYAERSMLSSKMLAREVIDSFWSRRQKIILI